MVFLVDHQGSLEALRGERVKVFNPTTLISNGDDDDDYNDNNNNNNNNNGE